ncbi:hypothetical protein PHISCL_03622 [Aspergillus sclerotialis]|uniref:Uncharacterized protein n=1 Tax=Aspergillus sclerotialis TaxID=2070753 RepID=A0A3A2ZLF1_9EURO|nr:hypothetical protein PHISCL_03622 [Aspergillus sclerotialis]
MPSSTAAVIRDTGSRDTDIIIENTADPSTSSITGGNAPPGPPRYPSLPPAPVRSPTPPNVRHTFAVHRYVSLAHAVATIASLQSFRRRSEIPHVSHGDVVHFIFRRSP